jgi:dephospho-CoA kinase
MNVTSSNKRTTKNTKKVLIGVIGRAGSGKSTFARMLAQNRARILDADKIAWELYSNPTVRKNLVETFGRKILNKDGAVDRKSLGKIVFTNPEKLKRLNAILHPLLVGELKHRIARSSQKVVIIDAALLPDWPLASECDLLIAVESEENVSLARLKSKGSGIKLLRSILENQRSRREFRELCHVLVENNKGLSELKLEADRIWQERIEPLLDT